MQSTLLLFQQVEKQNSKTVRIYIICDNVPYYWLKLVEDYLLNSRIGPGFLPSCTPTLNLIERYWKFFKKNFV